MAEIIARNDLEQLRTDRGLRAVEAAGEGSVAAQQPNGIYGFTYAPGEATIPLFAKKTWHSFEVHKLKDGTLYLVGFVTPVEAELVRKAGSGDVVLFPDVWENSTELVSVPLARIVPSRKGPSREGGNGLNVQMI
jgi:hypothetical protein